MLPRPTRAASRLAASGPAYLIMSSRTRSHGADPVGATGYADLDTAVIAGEGQGPGAVARRRPLCSASASLADPPLPPCAGRLGGCGSNLGKRCEHPGPHAAGPGGTRQARGHPTRTRRFWSPWRCHVRCSSFWYCSFSAFRSFSRGCRRGAVRLSASATRLYVGRTTRFGGHTYHHSGLACV